jgi:hypothetical protein
MNRDKRLFLVAAGEASTWEILCTRFEMACSPAAKARFRQYSTVKTVLALSLSDPDDRITIELRRRRVSDPRRLASLALLGLLLTVLFIEWRTYTYPAITQFLKYFAHECGIQ